MNIAHIIPHTVAFPLKGHNGRYEWVRQLALLQAKQGHAVTIYGNPESEITGLNFAGITEVTESKKNNNIETFRLAFSRDHDVYHSHFDNLHYEVAKETFKPVIYTQHWWPSEQTIELARTLNKGNVWAVPPTRHMFTFDIENKIQTIGYIHHGIDLNIFQNSGAPKTDRFLFVGRISPEKNLEAALSAIKKTSAKLDIVGKIAAKNQQYWNSLQHFIDGDRIRYLGQKSQAELVEMYSQALGVLCPFEPTEAFGLVIIESQACGTPVIMKDGGSRKELIREGETGFLYETEDEFIAAISKIKTIQAKDCISFAQNFNIVSMAQAYEQLYEKIV